MANTEKGVKGFTGRPLADRYWEKVKVAGSDECWEWIGARSKRGYGQIFFEGHKLKATHVALLLATGERVQKGLMVCHSCDNPPCCNPAHLWIGTMSDNINDAVAKGRVRPPNPETNWLRNKTHCKLGHPLIVKAKGPRRCPICAKEHNQKWLAKRAAFDVVGDVSPDNATELRAENERLRAALISGADYLAALYDNMLANDVDMLIDKSESPLVVADRLRAALDGVTDEAGNG